MFREILQAIALELERREISYMVIGGQAVLYYGIPRLTQDIDITLDLNTDRLPDLLQVVEDLDWEVLVDDAQKFVGNTWVLPCQTASSGIRVDFIFSFSPYERQAIKRARKVQIDQAVVKYASLEDVIIHKLIAGRARDLEDVRLMLEKNADADYDYLKLWLSEFEVELGNPYVEELERMKPPDN